MAASFADRVARACLDEYQRHPEFHPTARSNGVAQFTVLAAVVLVQEQEAECSPLIHCISLGTGSKCLPANKLPKTGEALHDSHAEVLARRAAIRWVFLEIATVAQTGISSSWIDRREDESSFFKMRDGVQVWMYVSTLPCGDASTTALAINQPGEMAELKTLSPMPLPERGTTARGRDNYNALGWLRTKPARADAPPTTSHACSDKLALWSLVGFQGALLVQIMGTLFLNGVIFGDVIGQFSEVDMDRILEDCQRALVDRLRPLPPQISTPPRLRILFTGVPFPHGRSQIPLPNVLSDPESHIWIAPSGSRNHGTSETIVNGFRRGIGPKRQANPRFQPLTCKASMMRLYTDIQRTLGSLQLQSLTYHQLKRTKGAEEYQSIKSMSRSAGAPLQGWLVSGRECENFSAESED